MKPSPFSSMASKFLAISPTRIPNTEVKRFMQWSSITSERDNPSVSLSSQKSKTDSMISTPKLEFWKTICLIGQEIHCVYYLPLLLSNVNESETMEAKIDRLYLIIDVFTE